MAIFDPSLPTDLDHKIDALTKTMQQLFLALNAKIDGVSACIDLLNDNSESLFNNHKVNPSLED